LSLIISTATTLKVHEHVFPLIKTNIFSILHVHCSLKQGYNFAIYSLVGQTSRFNDSKLDEIETKQSINYQSTVLFLSSLLTVQCKRVSHTCSAQELDDRLYMYHIYLC